jgi:cobalamin biosynthesis protein CobD/CbiB
LARIGAVCAVIGGVTMAVMALTSLGYAANVLTGSPSEAVALFLPGVFIGIVVGFGSFGLATLRTDVYSRSVGVLFFLLVFTFLFNIGSSMAGVASPPTVLGVVIVLALSKLTLGYLFRTKGAFATPESVEAASDSLA